MGLNLITACHKHKVKVFHFRSEENYTIIPFYYKHQKCMGENPDNVETLDDQYHERDWMQEYPDGYPVDGEIQYRHPFYKDHPEHRQDEVIDLVKPSLADSEDVTNPPNRLVTEVIREMREK